MATLQEQYEDCVRTKLCLGFDERAARANCRNQLLRLKQREQARLGQPVTMTIDIEDAPITPSDLSPAEPATPGVVSVDVGPAPEPGPTMPEGISLPRMPQPVRGRRKRAA